MEIVSIYKIANLYDPSGTTALRNAFARDMNKRFSELTAKIREGVVKNDCFGLNKDIQTLQMVPPQFRQFAFMRDPEKVEAFMAWLQTQVDKGLLKVSIFQQVGKAVEAVWTNMYILDSYKRGVIRAREELRKAGLDIPSIESSGGIDIVMGNLFHMDRVGLMFTRTFTELQGITAAMDVQISKILAQGLIDGDGPRLLARKLISTINGDGVDRLGIKDTLGRFISAQRRAEMLARTEILRSFNEAQLVEFKNWGIEGVSVLAEISTAGDDRVCFRCQPLEGKIYTLEEVSGLLPLHPNCFIDPQIPIYTSNGWKPIGDIKIGDFVLTHKRRFRKVYALPRHNEKANIVTITFDGTKQHISVTENHPILVTDKDNKESKWINAGDLNIGDYVKYLGNTYDDFITYPITNIKKWTLERDGKLFNLSVEDDESYIAKGVVVHNCRCIYLPYIEELKKYYTN
jgi:SPP1 gp7 family putative phage head morphogenesis protein